jgi:hypothetical protein
VFAPDERILTAMEAVFVSLVVLLLVGLGGAALWAASKLS